MNSEGGALQTCRAAMYELWTTLLRVQLDVATEDEITCAGMLGILAHIDKRWHMKVSESLQPCTGGGCANASRILRDALWEWNLYVTTDKTLLQLPKSLHCALLATKRFASAR